MACHSLGLGEFTVDEHGAVMLERSPQRAKLRDLGIRSVLTEEHKTFAQAGNDKGERWTPFQGLKKKLVEAVAEQPGIKISEFAECTEHHYGTDQAAVRTLRRVIKQGGIKGIEVRHGGRCYPAGWNRHSVKAEA